MTSSPTPVPDRGRRASAPAWVFWVALLPVLAAILGFGGAYSYIWGPVDCVLFAGLALLVWSRGLSACSADFHPLLWPMGAFGALGIVQWLWRLTVYPGETLTGLVLLAGCGAAFCLTLFACRDGRSLGRLGWILWLFCGLLGTEAIFQAFGADGYIYWFHDATYANPVGPFVYHNHFAGCMDLLLPVAVAVAFRPGQGEEPVWLRRFRRGLAPAVGLAAVVVSGSRGGILVLLAEAGLASWVFWPDLKKNRRARHGLLLGAVFMVAFAALANWGPVMRRFGSLADHDPDLQLRLVITQATWHIFLAHPWVGTGFNTFATVYPTFQTYDNGLSVLYAHDDYAQALAETGILGGACVLAFLILWSRAFTARRRDRPHGPEARAARDIQLAGFIGSAGFLMHSVGDFEFHSPANALLFFLLTAASVAPAWPTGPFNRARTRRASRGLVAGQKVVRRERDVIAFGIER